MNLKLNSTDTAKLGKVTLAMARELWVVKDRLMALEAVMKNRDLLTVDELDCFTPSAQEQAEIDEKCESFIRSLIEQTL